MQNSKLPVTKKRKITCNSGLTLKGADILINNHEQSDLECISFSNPISRLVKNYRNIEKFHKKIQHGPVYFCVVCNRMLYRSCVKLFSIEKYPKPDLFTDLKSADDRKYICHTCHLKAMKNLVLCQAVINKMELAEIPPELHHLRKLESVLIARRIIFQKIVILPKGQQRKIKGVVCNVPVDSDTTCETLPRPPNSTSILLLKLKRNL